jgi:hypothetical protein
LKLCREEVLNGLFHRLYGKPVVRNDLRGELVEHIVGMALAPEWTHCGSDWGSCDLRHERTGRTIQVKQSAAQQSWAASNRGYSAPRFSIARKTGRYEGADWVVGRGRNADIFVFAWHDKSSGECDHADPSQWTFYVVPELQLPDQDSLGLRQIERLTRAVKFSGLLSAVDAVMPQTGGKEAEHGN